MDGFTNSYFPTYLSGTDDERIGKEFQNSDHESRLSHTQERRVVLRKKKVKKNIDSDSDSDQDDHLFDYDLTEDEIKKLFVFDIDSIFVKVLQDQEATEYVNNHITNENYDRDVIYQKQVKKPIKINTAPSFRYSVIPKNVKIALLRTVTNQLSFLKSFEIIMHQWIHHHQKKAPHAVKEYLNDHQLLTSAQCDEDQLIFTFNDPYHLFLVRGLALFYYFSVRSFTHPDYPSGILILKMNEYTSLPPALSFYDYLQTIELDEWHTTNMPSKLITLLESKTELILFNVISPDTIKTSGHRLKEFVQPNKSKPNKRRRRKRGRRPKKHHHHQNLLQSY